VVDHDDDCCVKSRDEPGYTVKKDGQKEKRPLPVWDQALSAVAEGIVVTDATLPDNPIVYLNAGF